MNLNVNQQENIDERSKLIIVLDISFNNTHLYLNKQVQWLSCPSI